MRAIHLFFDEPYVSSSSLSEKLGFDLSTAKDVMGILSVAEVGGKRLLMQHYQG
ncbi:MAG: hypothetical protein MR654_05390 [Corynebacterium glucuronolyticum]|nr:hypothetical protein [Corynebacterium glucuronolyticum]